MFLPISNMTLTIPLYKVQYLRFKKSHQKETWCPCTYRWRQVVLYCPPMKMKVNESTLFCICAMWPIYTKRTRTQTIQLRNELKWILGNISLLLSHLLPYVCAWFLQKISLLLFTASHTICISDFDPYLPNKHRTSHVNVKPNKLFINRYTS